jgi:hypothetical protein
MAWKLGLQGFWIGLHDLGEKLTVGDGLKQVDVERPQSSRQSAHDRHARGLDLAHDGGGMHVAHPQDADGQEQRGEGDHGQLANAKLAPALAPRDGNGT